MSGPFLQPLTARIELEFALEKVRDRALADITKGRMSTY